MLVAFDTQYTETHATTAALCFNAWADETASHCVLETLPNPAPYEPGSFYKRELPCILSLLKQLDLAIIGAIIIDGFVVLDDAGKPGLGAHLFAALGEKIPVVGVAKTGFKNNTKRVVEVYRGTSKRPLFVTASGMELQKAGAHIQQMHGPHRIPTLLKAVDAQARQIY